MQSLQQADMLIQQTEAMKLVGDPGPHEGVINSPPEEAQSKQ
jgi:hypothetical protein